MISFRTGRESIAVCATYLNSGKKYVGLPDFICSEVVTALEVHKIPLRFYPVEFDEIGTLKLKVEEIAFDEMGCCVVVNYFGRHHEANKILIDQCKKKGIGTIEDDTHILLMTTEDMNCDFRVDSRRKILGDRFGSVIDVSSNIRSRFCKESAFLSGASQLSLIMGEILDLVQFLRQSAPLRRCFRMINLSARKLVQSGKGNIGLAPWVKQPLAKQYIERRRKRLRAIRPIVDLHLRKFGLQPIDDGAECRGLVWRFWYIKTCDLALPSFITVDGLICCELCHWPNLPTSLVGNDELMKLASKIVAVEILRRL